MRMAQIDFLSMIHSLELVALKKEPLSPDVVEFLSRLGVSVEDEGNARYFNIRLTDMKVDKKIQLLTNEVEGLRTTLHKEREERIPESPF